MAANPYTSLDDIRAIVTDDIPEGVNLEYKRSAIITERDVNALCKTVTALANSAGGQFILGIESHAGKPVRLDGGVPGPSRRDWIHKVINASTFQGRRARYDKLSEELRAKFEERFQVDSSNVFSGN